MKTQGRAAASTLFVIGLGMLWAAGFAPSLATVVGEGISSLVVPILSGATVAALGVAQCCGAALERGPKLALAAAVALAGCAAVGFWPAASGGLVYARPILNGLLFFCWLVAFLRFRDGIADCAVPLGLLLGSALALVFAARSPPGRRRAWPSSVHHARSFSFCGSRAPTRETGKGRLFRMRGPRSVVCPSARCCYATRFWLPDPWLWHLSSA